jgi:short-subunit dehydrogenase
MADTRRVLLTGASRGLGAALARGLAARGQPLMLVARNEAALAQRVAECGAAGVHVAACAADLAIADDCERVARAAEQQFGGIDVLINNAGIGPYRPFTDHSAADIVRIVALNLTAPMLLARALLPGMLARGYGHVVNIASDLARRPLANMAPYVASKFGVLGFAGSLHRELRARGLKVTTVLPGIIDSGFNDAIEGSRDARWAMPTADLARQVIALLDLPAHLVADEIALHPAEGDY